MKYHHMPGVFIPFDINGGSAMDDLYRLLIKYGYCKVGEGIPEAYLCHSLEDSVVAYNLRSWMIQDNNGYDSPELEEKYRKRIRHLDKTIRRIRLEKEKKCLSYNMS